MIVAVVLVISLMIAADLFTKCRHSESEKQSEPERCLYISLRDKDDEAFDEDFYLVALYEDSGRYRFIIMAKDEIEILQKVGRDENKRL